MAARRSNEFEKAFQQLEKIVQRLEGEEIPLDDSLQLFEEGIRLSRFCHQRLEEVEKKIELILANAKGEAITEPFEELELEERNVEERNGGERNGGERNGGERSKEEPDTDEPPF